MSPIAIHFWVQIVNIEKQHRWALNLALATRDLADSFIMTGEYGNDVDNEGTQGQSTMTMLHTVDLSTSLRRVDNMAYSTPSSGWSRSLSFDLLVPSIGKNCAALYGGWERRYRTPPGVVAWWWLRLWLELLRPGLGWRHIIHELDRLEFSSSMFFPGQK